ncbi:hypothetical protein LZ554_005837 [Drepanopeziza brunnea f. sp. 'monogermtubi']|nr:hypothetical protein LZ554_005837 [Drepanopeziza brunnea f. sp. 'monogermtubi']
MLGKEKQLPSNPRGGPPRNTDSPTAKSLTWIKPRACASMQTKVEPKKNLQEFTLFTKLPIEIRDMIYGLIEDLEPCYIFPCRYNTRLSCKRVRITSIYSYKSPIVLHLCRESRNEFLVRGGANTTIRHTYTLVKRMTSLSKPIYVRLNRDNLFLQDLGKPAFSSSTLPKSSGSFADMSPSEPLFCMAIYTMRHITIAVPFDQIRPKLLALQLRRFNLLESLTLVLALEKREAKPKEMDLIVREVEAELQATKKRFPGWTAQPVVKTAIITFGLQDHILTSTYPLCQTFLIM